MPPCSYRNEFTGMSLRERFWVALRVEKFDPTSGWKARELVNTRNWIHDWELDDPFHIGSGGKQFYNIMILKFISSPYSRASVVRL